MTVNLLVILGPTASGKTALGVRLAREIGGEIISADSRQVYRGMDLGTGKDRDEYRSGGSAVPCHLIDLLDPEEEFHLFAFQRLFFQCFENIRARGAFPILVGGSGLYIEAVLMNYPLVEAPVNPALRNELENMDLRQLRERLRIRRPNPHNTTDWFDRGRLIRAIEIAEADLDPRRRTTTDEPPPALSPFVIGVHFPPDRLRERITARLRKRLADGLIEEVRGLHERGLSWERIDRFGLEYRYVAGYLQGRMDENEMFRVLNIHIHQFAKRQRSWFRRMEKRGVRIHWIPGDDYAALRDCALRHLERPTGTRTG